LGADEKDKGREGGKIAKRSRKTPEVRRNFRCFRRASRLFGLKTSGKGKGGRGGDGKTLNRGDVNRRRLDGGSPEGKKSERAGDCRKGKDPWRHKSWTERGAAKRIVIARDRGAEKSTQKKGPRGNSLSRRVPGESEPPSQDQQKTLGGV